MEAYLQHHGIRGQKWGVRRFQEEDGSLTAAGRERYGVENTNSGNKNKDNSESVAKRKALLKKAAVGLGAAALVGASAVALKKSTDLRNEMRSLASNSAKDFAASKKRAAQYSRNDFASAKMHRDTVARIERNKNSFDSSTYNRSRQYHDYMARGSKDAGRRMTDIIKQYHAQELKYRDISLNATRRQAVSNYIRNKGKLVI